MKADKVLYKEKENIPKTTCIIRQSWGFLCLVTKLFLQSHNSRDSDVLNLGYIHKQKLKSYLFCFFQRLTIANVSFLYYLCSNRFRHASHRTAYQGGTFAFYAMNKYNNKALSIQEQIERLKKYGLIIDDVNQANKTLSIISYFRLACYWRPME